MEFVIITDFAIKDIPRYRIVGNLLIPYKATVGGETLYLNEKGYRYMALDNHVPLQETITSLKQIDGIIPVYGKTLDRPLV